MVSKPKVATPRIVALVLTTLDNGPSPTLLFAADEPPQTPAAAQPADDDRWQFNVAPYLWGASLNGNVKIGRVEEDVDLNFIDVLKDFSFGGMLYAEARKPRYGIFTNVFFVRTRDDSSGTVDTDVKSDTAQVAAGGFYRVVDWQWGEGSDGRPLRLAIEPLVGCGGAISAPRSN